MNTIPIANFCNWCKEQIFNLIWTFGLILNFLLNLIISAACRYFSWQRTSNGHNFLKNDPNRAYEVFFDIYIFQIGHVRIIFEKVIAILKFAAKFFTSYRWAADIFLDFFLSIIS